MEMKINIEIGVTEQLAALARGLLCGLTARAETAPQISKLDSPDKQENPENPGRGENPEKQENPGAQTEQQPSQQPSRQPKGDEIPWEPAEVDVTDEDMKAAMDIALSRFCGNGWRESSDPKTLAIRKELTKLFKQIAGHFGAEKPTKLSKERRHDFMTTLESIKLGEDGMPEWLPF